MSTTHWPCWKNVLPLIRCWLLLKAYITSLEKDSKTSKKYAACLSGTLFPWKSPTPAFSSHCQPWYNYVFILVSQVFKLDVGRLWKIFFMFSEHRCFVLLCYNSKWTTNGPEYWPTSKTENTWVQSVSFVWVLCWKSDFIFIKWYYITIIPFFKRTLWVKIYVIWNHPLFGVAGVFSPALFMMLFVLSYLIGVKSNAIKISGRSEKLYQCMLLWLNEGNNLCFFIVVFYLVSLVHRKIYISWL